MWYRRANLLKLSEYWSDKKFKDDLFEIVAKSFKRKKANGDEDRLLEIEKEDPGENINIIIKIKIGNDIHSLLHNSFSMYYGGMGGRDLLLKNLDEFCEKYFVDNNDKDRVLSIIEEWIPEYFEYVKR